MQRKCPHPLASLMTLPVAKRREYFAAALTLHMAEQHAAGAYSWPIEKLPASALAAFQFICETGSDTGAASKSTRKYFGLRTNKAVREFLN